MLFQKIIVKIKQKDEYNMGIVDTSQKLVTNQTYIREFYNLEREIYRP